MLVFCVLKIFVCLIQADLQLLDSCFCFFRIVTAKSSELFGYHCNVFRFFFNTSLVIKSIFFCLQQVFTLIDDILKAIKLCLISIFHHVNNILLYVKFCFCKLDVFFIFFIVLVKCLLVGISFIPIINMSFGFYQDIPRFVFLILCQEHFGVICTKRGSAFLGEVSSIFICQIFI